MRLKLLSLTVVMLAVLGATCVPLIDNTPATPNSPATSLALTFVEPSRDRSVPQGTRVTIRWQAINTGATAGSVEIYIESRTDLSRITLAASISVRGSTGTNTLEWDTSGLAAGEYSIRGMIVTSGQTREALAAGRITINTAPSLRFTEPTALVTLMPRDTTTIGWSVNDDAGGGRIRLGVDPDLDHGSGNELFILQRDLASGDRADTFTWDGNDTAGTRVPDNTYNLFALVEDDVNPLVTAEGLARFIVAPDDPDEDITLGVRQPSTDFEFNAFSPDLPIEIGVNDTSDVLIDLKIDPDESRTNGNEITILSQRLVAADTPTESFDWNGTDTSNVAVPDGIYNLVIVANRGSGTPQTVAGANLLFVRIKPENAQSRQTWQRTGPTWARVSPGTTPTARRDTGFAHDRVAQNSVLFGGSVGGTPNNETWTWNRSNWTQRSIAGPPAVFGHAMTFDRANNVVLLFGGTDGTAPIDQTWTYNGTEWAQEIVAGPSARFYHDLDFDEERGVVVLFGGTDGATPNNETWDWDGEAWVLKSPAAAPAAREQHRVAFDQNANVLVLFGGLTATGPSNETWTFDGTNWTQRTPPNSPIARRGHGMRYDESRGRIVLFGGTDGQRLFNDTWEWTGEDWELQAATVAPPAREGFAFTYDRFGGGLQLFGGVSGLPIISLTSPSAAQTVDPGNFVAINWRDDDPTGEATVRVVVDDDAHPSEGTETGDPELEILASRPAGPDGVQDTFSWQVPASLDPGTYFIFAYIDRNGMAPFDNRAIAGGRVIVRDPANP